MSQIIGYLLPDVSLRLIHDLISSFLFSCGYYEHCTYLLMDTKSIFLQVDTINYRKTETERFWFNYRLRDAIRSFYTSSNYRLAAIFVPINRYEPRVFWMNKMTEQITDVSIVVKLRAWRDGGLQTSSETFNAAGDHCLRGVPMASHDEGPQPLGLTRTRGS